MQLAWIENLPKDSVWWFEGSIRLLCRERHDCSYVLVEKKQSLTVIVVSSIAGIAMEEMQLSLHTIDDDDDDDCCLNT